MRLPEEFTFSQSNLQDYLTCARRFELRHLHRLAWPAVESEPVAEYERHMQLGADFHHMVHQHMVGVPEEAIALRTGGNPKLAEYWQAYLGSDFVKDLPVRRFAEVSLLAHLCERRLIAKYDLIAIEPGERVIIVDWKTSPRLPSSADLAQRMQTIVYRYLLVRAGAQFNGGVPCEPEQVEMVYWFTEQPDVPIRFAYSYEQYLQDEKTLRALAAEVGAREDFPRLPEPQRPCNYCVFRSLCWENVTAGQFVDEDDVTIASGDSEFDLGFDQIAEIEF